MSFSGDVKEELSKHISAARHCQLAEMAAILNYCSRTQEDASGHQCLIIRSENSAVLRKCFTLLKKTFNIDTDIFERHSDIQENGSFYQFQIMEEQGCREILDACKRVGNAETVSPMLIKNSCCKRAYLRGAYLTIGSMSNPQKAYHLEFVCSSDEQAQQLCEVLNSFELDAKIVLRKKYHVVYMKEGSCIVDLLNIVEAHIALMNLENMRILKDISNSVNRRVNCETANIVKTVNAANRQVADIQLIQDRKGLASLPENLRETAQLRLDYPDATLMELAQMMNPPIGKSGINHRLRKLSEIAEDLR